MSEHRGPWQQVSRCKRCGWTTSRDIKFMDRFFTPVCPGCGEDNFGLFRGATAREVRRGMFRRFVRWEEAAGE